MSHEREKKKRLRARLLKIPFIGDFLLIANGYAYFGSVAHLGELAPWEYWKERLSRGVLSSLILTIVILSVVKVVEVDIESFNPESILLSLYPNLLGFGIGVFALLFALPSEYTRQLIEASESKKNQRGGEYKALRPEMLPVDMAYPLAVYCVSILITLICNIFPDSWISTGIILDILIYGVFVTFGLLKSLFLTATYIMVVRRREYRDSLHVKTTTNPSKRFRRSLKCVSRRDET